MNSHDADRPSGVYRMPLDDTARLAADLARWHSHAVLHDIAGARVLLAVMLDGLRAGLGVKREHLDLLRGAANDMTRQAPGTELERVYVGALRTVESAPNEALTSRRTG